MWSIIFVVVGKILKKTKYARSFFQVEQFGKALNAGLDGVENVLWKRRKHPYLGCSSFLFLFLAILSTTFLKLQAQYNPLADTISFSKFTFNDSELYLECKTA